MKIITTTVLLLLVSASALADEPQFSIGISGRFSAEFHSGTFNFSNPQYDTSIIGRTRYSFDNGTGFSFAASGVVTFDKSARYSLGLSIGSLKFSSQSEIIIDTIIQRLLNGDTILNEMFIGNEYSQKVTSADLDFRYKLFDNNELGVIAGASFRNSISSSYRYRYGVVFNPSVTSQDFFPTNIDSLRGLNGYKPTFTDETRTSVNLYDGALPDINSLQISLRAGLFYDFAIDNIIIAPSVVYHFPLTKVSSSQDWKIYQLTFSLDIRVSL